MTLEQRIKELQAKKRKLEDAWNVVEDRLQAALHEKAWRDYGVKQGVVVRGNGGHLYRVIGIMPNKLGKPTVFGTRLDAEKVEAEVVIGWKLEGNQCAA